MEIDEQEGLSPEQEALLRRDEEQAGVPFDQIEGRPEADNAPDTEEEPEPEPEERHVPLAALLQERERRQALEAQLQQSHETLTRWDERLRMAQQYAARQAEAERAQAQPGPDPEEDPVGYVKWHNEQLRNELEATKAQIAQYAERGQLTQQQQQEQQQRVAQVAYLNNLTNQFAAQHPDYYQALEFMAKRRLSDLEVMGYDERARLALLQADADVLTQGALRAGRNPAEAVYQLAQQWGYRPEGAEVPNKVTNIQRGRAVSRSLSGARAARGGPSLTVEALANVSDDEFARTLAQNPGLFEKLAGGA